MSSLTLFSLYSNDLLKYKNYVIKTFFHRGFELKNEMTLIKIKHK